jgi:hypothetical protein
MAGKCRLSIGYHLGKAIFKISVQLEVVALKADRSTTLLAQSYHQKAV